MDAAGHAGRDGAWQELGLAAPARRALVNAGILTTEDLRGWTKAELLALHGIGKSALPALLPFIAEPGT